MTGTPHIIKPVYVPIQKVPTVRAFEDLCRKNNVKFSHAVLALIERELSWTNSPKESVQRNKVRILPALENYTTSQREAHKKKMQKLDEDWIRSRKK